NTRRLRSQFVKRMKPAATEVALCRLAFGKRRKETEADAGVFISLARWLRRMRFMNWLRNRLVLLVAAVLVLTGIGVGSYVWWTSRHALPKRDTPAYREYQRNFQI